MKEAATATFRGLIDLASAQFGGSILNQSDEFFGRAARLLAPGRGIWIEGKFTEQGKWVDGWETRRKRGPGNDWCLIRLGAPGIVQGLDIDTNHFSGNHPAYASVDGACIAAQDALTEQTAWHPLLEQSPLFPSSQNLFIATSDEPVTHLRLNIFPDGGVSRFRAYGTVANTWPPAELDSEARQHVEPDWVDLAAARNGALALICNDAYFGPMNNLLMPGRGANMGDGWETRRRRGPGHDWLILRLAERGIPRLFECDTNHFKGNYPDYFKVDAVDAPQATLSELTAEEHWTPLLPQTHLAASARKFIPVKPQAPVTHLRIRIFPDGGINRFRAWGERHG